MRVEVVRSPAGLAALHDAWNDLAARARPTTPALTPEWFLAWWGAFGGGAELHVLTVRDGERILALAPMMLTARREWGLRWRVASLMTNAHSPLGGVLLGERADQCLDEILRHFAGDAVPWDLLQLDHLVQGPDLDRLLERVKALGLPQLVETKRTAPVLDISGTWEHYLGERGRSFRESIRRKVKKAAQAGATASVHAGPADAEPLVERAFAVASRSWSGRHGTAINSTTDLASFYRGLAVNAARRGWLSLAFLECGGRDVAFEFNLDYAGARYNLKMAFDEAQGALSPGQVLRFHVLKDAFERGLGAFYFLGDREQHKDHWASRWDDHCRLTVYNHRLLPRARHLVRGPLWESARRIPYLRRLKRLFVH